MSQQLLKNYLLYLYDRRTSNMEELKRVPKEDVLTSIKLNSVIQDDWWRCLQDQDRTKCNFRILQFLYYSGRLIICWVCTNMSQIKKRLQSDSGAMTVINLHLTQLMTSLPGCTSFFSFLKKNQSLMLFIAAVSLTANPSSSLRLPLMTSALTSVIESINWL